MHFHLDYSSISNKTQNQNGKTTQIVAVASTEPQLAGKSARAGTTRANHAAAPAAEHVRPDGHDGRRRRRRQRRRPHRRRHDHWRHGRRTLATTASAGATAATAACPVPTAATAVSTAAAAAAESVL